MFGLYNMQVCTCRGLYSIPLDNTASTEIGQPYKEP